MKKTLLIAAAALAAGVITSQAQVYSQNIVGYVNQTYVPGFVNISAPLDSGAGNSLTNVIPNVGGALDGALIYTWNGAGYTIYTIDSTFPTGLANFADTVGVPSPTVNPGELVFLLNNTGVQMTNTFVGSVHVEGAGVSVGSTTNVLGLGYSFIASKLPVAGGISSVLGLTNTGGVLDGALVYIPNIDAGGTFLGYNIFTIDSSFPTGYANFADTVGVSEPTVAVGNGFIILNNTGVPYNWVQSL